MSRGRPQTSSDRGVDGLADPVDNPPEVARLGDGSMKGVRTKLGDRKKSLPGKLITCRCAYVGVVRARERAAQSRGFPIICGDEI
jgi:hypothetical protein